MNWKCGWRVAERFMNTLIEGAQLSIRRALCPLKMLHKHEQSRSSSSGLTVAHVCFDASDGVRHAAMHARSGRVRPNLDWIAQIRTGAMRFGANLWVLLRV